MAELDYFITNDKMYKLKTPISLDIYTDDDGDYFAENTQFDIIGMSGNEGDAIEDARNEIGQIYEWKFETNFPTLKSIQKTIEMIDNLM